MTRIGRALAAAFLGALLGAAWLAFFYGVHPQVDIPFDVDPPRVLVTGVYPAERDRASGLTFAWTGQELALRLPGLDRSVEWTLAVRLRGARVDPGQNPVVSFYADGVPLGTRPTKPDFETVEVVLPARPEARRGATITIQSSRTFVPGPADRRALGVMIDEIRLTPSGVPLPPRRAFAGAAMAAAILGAAVALLGVTTGSAVGAAVVLSAGDASLVARGFGPFTDYPVAAAVVAAWVGVLLVAVSGAVELQRGQPLRNTARFVAAWSAGAAFLKLLILFHPNMPIGDALFHAHRFQWVLAGKLYFTSIAPGNYMFPYAPGLYVAAAPFAALIPRGDGDMAILRIVVIGIDTAVAISLYVSIVRAWGNRVAGAMAVAIYHLLPLDFGIVATGNLTNAFAQSLSVLVFALLASDRVVWEKRRSVALLSAILSAAFMSHTSTGAILFVSGLVIAGLFFWNGPEWRSASRAVAVAAVVALVVSVVLYYGHFGETYRSELLRIGRETASGASDAGGRGIGARAVSVPRYLHEYLGIPALVLAAAGGWQLWRRSARDRLALTVAGWMTACLLFLAVGVLTPVDMRYYLASIPGVAILAAAGASAWWADRGSARWVATGLLVWVVWLGIDTCWGVLR